jgi:hypothetical protein
MDFMQQMMNHIMVPLRRDVQQINMINTIAVDGCYGGETRDALNLIMNGGPDPILTSSNIIATKVSHHNSESNSPKTFLKLVNDYNGITSTDTGKILDREILVGLNRSTTDKHPTSDPDIGIYELYGNDDWDGDGISNYIEVENSEVGNNLNPLIANPEYTTPANANNQYVSVERGVYNNGLLHGGLRIANVNKGYYYFGGSAPDKNNYGTLRTLRLIETVAKAWDNLHPDLAPLKKNIFANGDGVTNLRNNDIDGDGTPDVPGGTDVRIGIGNLSLQPGGKTDHHSHQNGLDADIRLVRSDNKEHSLDLQIDGPANYSVDYTLSLINLFIDAGASFIAVDPLAGIEQGDIVWIDLKEDSKTHLRAHRHHMHVRFPLANTPTGVINLTPANSSIKVGSSTTIISGQIRDIYGFPLIPGVLIKIKTDAGLLNGQGDTVTVPVDAEGKISLTLSADEIVSTVTVTASSIQGDAAGNTTVHFIQ